MELKELYHHLENSRQGHTIVLRVSPPAEFDPIRKRLVQLCGEAPAVLLQVMSSCGKVIHLGAGVSLKSLNGMWDYRTDHPGTLIKIGVTINEAAQKLAEAGYDADEVESAFKHSVHEICCGYGR